MNATVAKNTYQNIKNKTRSDEEIGYDVISIALKKLETNLCLLSKAEKASEITKPFENSISTIYILQKGLDMSSGGDLAKNLFQLYEFCRVKVVAYGGIQVFGKSDSGVKAKRDIELCHSYIKEISKSWEQSRIR